MCNVYLMIGLDCDRPRGDYINTPLGKDMALRKIESLNKIKNILNKLSIPRTYFICGQFLESMATFWCDDRMREVFSSQGGLSEIADHTYSHNIFKSIPSRPDKLKITPKQAINEYRINTSIFSKIFKIDCSKRGLRAPLGYYQGLSGENELIQLFHNEGLLYISSDLRNKSHSILTELKDEYNNIRQPYFYSCGLLEIPGHGWHDTAFSKNSKTPIYEKCPVDIIEISSYYESLICQAISLSEEVNKRLYLGLVMHPYDISLYDKNNELFLNLNKLKAKYRFDFCKYQDAANWYKKQSIQ